MMKPVQKINLRKFIKRAAFITLILASLEVLVFLFLLSEKNQNNTSKDPEKTSKHQPVKPLNYETDKSSFIDTPQNLTPAVSKLSLDPVQNLDSSHSLDNTSSTHSNSIIKLPNEKVKQPISSQTLLPIQLSNQRMLLIIKSIGTVKKRTHNKLNCVQIRKTSNSNVTNAFKIAELLKARGYIISGRIVIPGNLKGMKITTQSGCIQLTIGNFFT